MDAIKVGEQIQNLRKAKNLTQNELGERLHVSFQAVSKWERGETMPDVAILPMLADVLETTIDTILRGEEISKGFKGKFFVSDLKEGLNCLRKMNVLLGKDNIIYKSAINGITASMNTQIEEIFSNDYHFDAFLCESILDSLSNGYYVDPTDIKNNISSDHFKTIALDACKKYKII